MELVAIKMDNVNTARAAGGIAGGAATGWLTDGGHVVMSSLTAEQNRKINTALQQGRQ